MTRPPQCEERLPCHAICHGSVWHVEYEHMPHPISAETFSIAISNHMAIVAGGIHCVYIGCGTIYTSLCVTRPLQCERLPCHAICHGSVWHVEYEHMPHPIYAELFSLPISNRIAIVAGGIHCVYYRMRHHLHIPVRDQPPSV